jgi:predicted kinase
VATGQTCAVSTYEPETGTPTGRATLFVMVGLPGSGKTTRARQLEREHQALRLTPDEWMIPLFGQSQPNGTRDVLEGRFVWLAMHALRIGCNVVLDFGVWSRDERSALRDLALQAGAECVLVYLPVARAEQRNRVETRFAAEPHSTFEMTPEDLHRYEELFQVPTSDELAGDRIDPPPPDHDTWAAWAHTRWPTSQVSAHTSH